MTLNGTRNGCHREKILELYTGNIMMDGGRAGFLNTSMSKSNVELINSLKNIKPEDGEERQWLWKEGEIIRLQNVDPADALLNCEAGRDDFDVTVKLFFLPEGKSDIESRRMYAHEALSSVAKQLGIDKFDTLILSLPGIVLEKDEEDYHSKEFPISNKTLDEWIKTWNILETIHAAGQASSLGISEFGIIRLATLLPHIEIRPAVDQINLRDCCDVPHDLLDFGKLTGIELMPHMDKDNPLPKQALQSILDDLGVNEQLTSMRWVVKYTAIVKDRGVVENKGYIVSAEVQ